MMCFPSRVEILRSPSESYSLSDSYEKERRLQRRERDQQAAAVEDLSMLFTSLSAEG